MEADEYATRPDFDEYFMSIARVVSTRADCRRASHGSVIVRDNRVLSTGYNGLPSKAGSCLEGDCPRGLLSYEECPAFGDYSSCRALHSEQNAIAYARQDLTDATIYVVGGKAPCDMCAKLIVAAGIIRVVHDGLGGEWNK